MIVDIDLRDALCLACFSSLLSEKQAAHITKCCKQIICDSCIQANPRLATYEPCLACLGGISASRGKFPSQNTSRAHKAISGQRPSIDIDNGTMFVVGDDSDEDTEDQGADSELPASFTGPSPPKPPPYQEVVDHSVRLVPSLASSSPPEPSSEHHMETETESAMGLQKYYINSRDTLHGIALRFGVDARDLCRQNALPFSTLSTTPHLLHTRAFLTLPPASKPIPLQYVLSKDDQMKRDAQRAKERAEKRLQMVTKEVDWRVAKTYVALADSPECKEDTASTCNMKEGAGLKGPISKSTCGETSSALQSRAVDMYLEDEEWERNELAAGRPSQIPRFPLSNKNATSPSGSGTKAKWCSHHGGLTKLTYQKLRSTDFVEKSDQSPDDLSTSSSLRNSIPPPHRYFDSSLSMHSSRTSRPMTYENDMRPVGPHTQLNQSWYPTATQFAGLQLPDTVPSHGSSPQSSNGSLLGTPYQVSGSIAEIGDAPYGSSRLHHDGSPMMQSTPTNPVNGLGLVLPEPRKASPLGMLYGPGSNGLSLSDYPREGQNTHDIAHWNDSDTDYQNGAGPSYGFYNQAPVRSQSSHFRSYSDNGSAEILSTPSPNFSSESSPFGSHRTLPAPINRSNSLPPLMSTDYYSLPQPNPQWNNSQNNYVHIQSHYQNPAIPSSDEGSYMRRHSPQQWLSPSQTHEDLNSSPSPTSNASESASPALFQARVGSDRTRAISRQRRTNPDKKLFATRILTLESNLMHVGRVVVRRVLGPQPRLNDIVRAIANTAPNLLNKPPRIFTTGPHAVS
ncbi:hypothetical protein NP233_g7184 [Leucocoprinus birnbaumii]|uniref:LysM domain-containing protein n=1 Tax=Leucocoprinus birnbaumii TaxID=56174 RepID=A0AAD5YUU9_9AGAR|nr:hypothetical protein NP233_g7184 [Leucocoprinus birnbaumii]